MIRPPAARTSPLYSIHLVHPHRELVAEGDGQRLLAVGGPAITVYLWRQAWSARISRIALRLRSSSARAS
jgi:hypothetical protein